MAAAHPSDDLMTDLLEAEVEDPTAPAPIVAHGGSVVHRDDRRRGRTKRPPVSSDSWRSCSPITRISVVNSPPIPALIPGAIEETLRL